MDYNKDERILFEKPLTSPLKENSRENDFISKSYYMNEFNKKYSMAIVDELDMLNYKKRMALKRKFTISSNNA
uniref:Uncharacterized protein n=1 Tax=Rhabditophanes sp. KR3021 TaxID=114890 RepID=A0AC35TSX3_9BILA